MKAHIDISVFTEREALGVISGAIELRGEYEKGSIFEFPGVWDFDEIQFGESRLRKRMKIEAVIDSHVDGRQQKLLALEDLYLKDVGDLKLVEDFLGEKYGLYVDYWETTKTNNSEQSAPALRASAASSLRDSRCPRR